MRLTVSLVLCLVVVFGFVTLAHAAEKEVTLDGKITCARCELKQSAKCATVIVVKEGGKDVVYYFDPKADKANHQEICQEGKKGKVVGKVSEKDGKKTVTVSKVEFAK